MRRWPVFMAAVCILGIAIGIRQVTRPAPMEPKDAPVPFLIDEIPETLLDGAFAARSSYPVMDGTRILLVPHHLVAGREVASLLASTSAPKRVLLLTPDHFSQGGQPFSTTAAPFAWRETATAPNEALEERLLAALPGILKRQDQVFMREHGVRGLVPFFATAWPGAAVVPMTVRVDAPRPALTALVETLRQVLLDDPDLLVVITIDFSHDLPAYIADLHDRLALDALAALDETAADRVEIDSPPLFFVLTSLAKALSLGSVTVHAHTNALRLMKTSATDLGTSHVIASFAPGMARARQLTSELRFDPRDRIWSAENRFFQGYDRVTTTTFSTHESQVVIRTATSTETVALPLKPAGAVWLPFTDRERAARR